MLHSTYVGGVEPGERNLTMQKLECIAEMLGVNPLKLLQRRGQAEELLYPDAILRNAI